MKSIQHFKTVTIIFSLLTPNMTTQANTSAQVIITANINEVISVDITTTQNNFTLNPGVALESHSIATIQINSNDPDGYEIALSSINDGSYMVNSEDSQKKLAYTVNYDDKTQIELTNQPTIVESSNTTSSNAAQRLLSLDISSQESTGLPSGGYTDTITVTIKGK